jgi:porphyrinogen peroxidase
MIATAQPGIAAPLSQCAFFLVGTINPGEAAPAHAIDAVAGIPALVRAVGARAPGANLSCVVGIGADAWTRLGGTERPRELHGFRALESGGRLAPSTPGDLLLHIRAERHDLCFELATISMASFGDSVQLIDEVQGFRYFDDRDLIGFVDGTENPVGLEVDEAVFVGREDPSFVAGSYVTVQKYIHDLPKWNGLPVESQEAIIGRTKLDDVELDEATKPSFAHNALTKIVVDGRELKIVRRNMPFGTIGVGDSGTYFIAYSRSPQPVEQMLQNMFIGDPPGNYDRLLDFTHAVTGTNFFAASQDTIANLAATAAKRSMLASAGAGSSGPANGSLRVGSLRESRNMNNLHRELAPISEEAWAQIDEEATRTLKRHLAGRRVVDVRGPEGLELSADGTGHVVDAGEREGVRARLRSVQPVMELRVPFELDRQAIDDVERGAEDSDWQPLKDAARAIAFFEDRAIFDGYEPGRIAGIRTATNNPVFSLPATAEAYPEAIAGAISQLRLVGVSGPYNVLLSADAYTAVSEETSHGYPIVEHIRRMIEGEIIWAPAISGAVVLTTRGGDFTLHLGQDFSLGYLGHTDTAVRLYVQESFTFRTLTAEAAVSLVANM